MEPLLPLVIAATVFVTVAFKVIGRQRARVRSWHEAAVAARWEDVRADERFGRAFLEGRADGLPVRLQNYRRGRYESGTRLVIKGLARLSIRRESAATAIEKGLLGETEIEIGAPGFDERCFISGPPAIAYAVLDAETRRLLAFALDGRLALQEGDSLAIRASLSEGTLTLDCREGWGPSSERVRDLLRGGLDLARHLTLPPDLPLRIARNLAREREPGVRQRAVATLAREYPDNPATRPALLAGRQDASAGVRLQAALALGEEGRETLLALVTDEAVEDGCAASAVAALGEQLPEEEAVKALRRALRSGHAETALAAARALGHSGTVASVQELRAAAEWGPGELRSAARQAIAEIQSRLPGAGPGQLSLAAAAAGALSVVEDAGGGLSVVDTREEERSVAGAAPRARQSE